MNILFVCRGNVARSQEAAAFLGQTHPELAIQSAGTHAVAGKPLDPLVLQAMDEVNIDLAAAHRKPLEDSLVVWANRIISFVPLDQLPPAATAKAEYWPVEDPKGRPIETHRQVRDQIQVLVSEHFPAS
jgi:arsenate reductase